MMGSYILDDNDEPVLADDIMKWAFWMKGRERRIVKQEEIRDLFLSTVFLAIDHNFGIGGKPILWETMIFYRGSDPVNPLDTRCLALNHWCRRYDSRQEAIATHEKIAELLRQGVETEVELEERLDR